MKRRAFLTSVAVGAGLGTVGVPSASALPNQTPAAATPAAATPASPEPVAGMPRRQLGRTGQYLSIIGYAGFALRDKARTQAECTTSLSKALEAGVNYFDVAPAYDDGLCEIRMGEGFAQISEFRRESIFLACKTKLRTRAGAQEELDRSLTRLKTDYFDLYQLHCLIKPEEDVEPAFAANGAMEAILKAKEQGKIKHIGFSAHTTKAALAAMNKFHFDSVMFPINFLELFTFGFGKQVCELAAQQGVGVLAIKPMSAGTWPAEIPWEKRPRQWWYRSFEAQEDIDLAYRFTLAQPAVVAGIPPAFLDLAERAWVAGHHYRPLSEEDQTRLRELAKQAGSVFKADELAMRSEAPQRDMAAHPHRGDHHHGCPGMMS
jgi:predicted aldo/keto reductase-like oxidoreductase